MLSSPEPQEAREAGVALPTALLAMLVLLMLGGLFVAYANPQQRATAVSVNREAGLLVAESAGELAAAAMADTEQPDQPYSPGDSAPEDPGAARDWAVNHAIGRVDGTCSAFQRTANGDGIAVVDANDSAIYGVGFLPDCQTRTTTRVMRVNYDTRPVEPLPASFSILTGGDIYFDHANARIGAGGIHANGDIVGTPGSVDGPYSATGTCTDSDCTAGAAYHPIPNFTARHFWEQRFISAVNPNNDPFYELCHDGTSGTIRERSPAEADQPCTGGAVSTPNPNWVFTNVGGVRTWTWTANAGPPDGQYYAYGANIVNRMNNGNGNSSRISLFAEARNDDLAAGGGVAGSITFTENPKLFPSWPGVAVIADVDVMIEKNLHVDGQMALVFAYEQFRINYNGAYDRVFFMNCDVARHRHEAVETECSRDEGQKSSVGSPIDYTRITQNATFTQPPTGDAIVPNLGITGMGNWEVLPG